MVAVCIINNKNTKERFKALIVPIWLEQNLIAFLRMD